MNSIDPKTMFKPFPTNGKNVSSNPNQFLARTNDDGDKTDCINDVVNVKYKCCKAVEELMLSIANEKGESFLLLNTGALVILGPILSIKSQSYLAPFPVTTVEFNGQKGVTLTLGGTDVYGKEIPLNIRTPLHSIETMDVARVYEAVKKQIESTQTDINELILKGFNKTKDGDRAIVHDEEGNYYCDDFNKIFGILIESYPATSSDFLSKMAKSKAIKMYKERQNEKNKSFNVF